MTEETARLVRALRERANAVTSFIVEYQSASHSGRIRFLSPDRFRAETSINDAEIITIRKGSKVQRLLPKRKEIWKYDLSDLPETLPLNFAVADLKDPFFIADESTLAYEGSEEPGAVHVFSAALKNWSKEGLLDTRKGFTIRYQPKSLGVRVRLAVDAESGLLRKVIGTDGTGKEVFRSEYTIQAVNVPLDESLFAVDESAASYKSIDIAEIFFSSMNPDAADAPPSVN